MGTYAATHIKHNNQLIPFSDSYDGYLSGGMGENNLLCIRNISTEKLRLFFDNFTAYEKMNVDNITSKNEIGREDFKLTDLLLHNFKQELLSVENDVIKDHDFHAWLSRVDGNIRTSVQGAPIVMGLNISVHYGRDYNEADYIIDLDEEAFYTTFAPFKVMFKDLRMMSEKQISMLCRNPFEDFNNLLEDLASKNNTSKEVVGFSLGQAMDMAYENNPHPYYSEEFKKQMVEDAKKYQIILDQYIHFLVNGEHEFKSKREEISSLPEKNDIFDKHMKDNFVGNYSTSFVSGAMDDDDWNFKSYSMSNFVFSKKEMLSETLKTSAFKNFLQENFGNLYQNLDKEVKISMESNAIQIISFNEGYQPLSFAMMLERVLNKYPRSVTSSSIYGGEGSSPEDKEFLEFYEDSMFYTMKDFLENDEEWKHPLILAGNKVNSAFAMAHIKDCLQKENIEYLDLKGNNALYGSLFALYSYNKELFEKAANSFMNDFSNLVQADDSAAKNHKDFYLNSVLGARKAGEYLMSLPFCNSDVAHKIKDFEQFVNEHSSTKSLQEFLTDSEKLIFNIASSRKRPSM